MKKLIAYLNKKKIEVYVHGLNPTGQGVDSWHASVLYKLSHSHASVGYGHAPATSVVLHKTVNKKYKNQSFPLSLRV